MIFGFAPFSKAGKILWHRAGYPGRAILRSMSAEQWEYRMRGWYTILYGVAENLLSFSGKRN
ncbi:hypothetical protein [Phaeodactylibacter luteus]|uniref:Uncharacterized protein n=1 Tax=Phaeodactylibacter luteus TaxID=1564516 RepID=A0A5C6RHP8_9BACT|nr:hypothetical protein [Phaeodactylibacter luteus]TXB61926.1 hypothetical protein FRY97_16430 [Phaeodactylibacter luteus]